MTLVRSFRLRMVGVSVLTSGLVLGAFAAVIWWKLQKNYRDTIDNDLKKVGYLMASMPPKMVDPSIAESLLKQNLIGGKKVEHFFIITVAETGSQAKSDNWLSSIDTKKFPPGESEVDLEFAAGAIPLLGKKPQLDPRFYSTTSGERRLRVGAFGSKLGTVHVAVDLAPFTEEANQIRNAFLFALPGALIIIALGSLYTAQRAIRPVEKLSNRMETLSSHALGEKLDVENMDREFSRLIIAYNKMMGRLEKSFEQATRFSADASHELKTPLAVMQGKIAQALQRAEAGSPEQRLFASLLEEIDQQQNILESLLLLSRADAGRLSLTAERINFSQWLEEQWEDACALADEKSLAISCEIEPDLWIEGDSVLLQRAVLNLVSNAVKYNREGGELVGSLKKIERGDKDHLELRIENSGETLSAEDARNVFQRFYRGKNGNKEGLGVGLSLAQEIVFAHGGEISFEADGEDRTTLLVALPIVGVE